MSRRPDFTALDGTEASAEAARIEAGEPWVLCEIAGLQFYAYGREDELLGTVMPQPGDRLHVVRNPSNRVDPNACEIWWRNSRQLGHLPRGAARVVAPLLDAGAALRAYVYRPGNGEAWSMRALLVGAAIQELHDDEEDVIPF